MKTTISSIATGTSKQYTVRNKIFNSAYKKDIYLKNSFVTNLGLEDDIQVDTKFHGGLDKAIHIGSSKHFDTFNKLFNQELDKLSIGCNIFIDNYDENDICIGDIYTIGDVKIQVTQPRQPCWKIGALFGKEANRYIIKQNAIGWYVRVLNEGNISNKDEMILKERISDITINELSLYLKKPPKSNHERIDFIINNPAIAQSYKDDFIRSLTKR